MQTEEYNTMPTILQIGVTCISRESSPAKPSFKVIPLTNGPIQVKSENPMKTKEIRTVSD